MASDPSAMRAMAMPSRAIETMAGSTLGRTSRKMMRESLAPWALAARTNSRWLHVMVLARVMRARIGMVTMPSARIRIPVIGRIGSEFCGSPLRKATIASASTSEGKASRMSNIVASAVLNQLR